MTKTTDQGAWVAFQNAMDTLKTKKEITGHDYISDKSKLLGMVNRETHKANFMRGTK